jgi:carbamoyl-phosphate synthase large subunit
MQLQRTAWLREARRPPAGHRRRRHRQGGGPGAFREAMAEIGQPVVPRTSPRDGGGALAVAEIGYPVIVRPAFTLGGAGGGAAGTKRSCGSSPDGLDASPITQILVERASSAGRKSSLRPSGTRGQRHRRLLHGKSGPRGHPHRRLHRGGAPAQTLSDKEFQMLRTASLDIISHLGIVGGCNVPAGAEPGQL